MYISTMQTDGINMWWWGNHCYDFNCSVIQACWWLKLVNFHMCIVFQRTQNGIDLRAVLIKLVPMLKKWWLLAATLLLMNYILNLQAC